MSYAVMKTFGKVDRYLIEDDWNNKPPVWVEDLADANGYSFEEAQQNCKKYNGNCVVEK